MKSPITIALIAILALAATLIGIADPNLITESQLGIENGIFTFPNGNDVYDPQWAGETIVLIECTGNSQKDQTVTISSNGRYVEIMHGFNPAPRRGATDKCWQAAEHTDPNQLNKMAQWFMRNAHLNGYKASFLANPR